MNEYLAGLVTLLKSKIDVDDVENFSITIFGVSLTVFTVLYSFIVSKQEIGEELQEKILNATANIEDKTRYKIICRQISKYKYINIFALSESLVSFALFIVCKVYAFFFTEAFLLGLIIDILYLILILGSVIMFLLLVKDYMNRLK